MKLCSFFFENIRGVNFLITVKIEIIIRKMEKVMCKLFSIWNSSICTVFKDFASSFNLFQIPNFFYNSDNIICVAVLVTQVRFS